MHVCSDPIQVARNPRVNARFLPITTALSPAHNAFQILMAFVVDNKAASTVATTGIGILAPCTDHFVRHRALITLVARTPIDDWYSHVKQIVGNRLWKVARGSPSTDGCVSVQA